MGRYVKDANGDWHHSSGMDIIDDELSATSSHPLKNSAITEALNTKYDTNDSTSSTINDTDYVPMSETNGTKKKTLWSTIIAKIKAALATVATSGSYNDLTNKPSFATVATSGSYTDLSNKPTIPTYVDGTGLSSTAVGSRYTFNVDYGTTEGTACQGNDSRLSNSRTPTSHASTGTGYGGGTASNYGHVKLSDTYTSSVGAAANSIGASQNALYKVYQRTNFQFLDFSINTGAFSVGQEKYIQTTTIKNATSDNLHGLGIIGWHLTGNGYTNLLLTQLTANLAKNQTWTVDWSLKNIGSSATGEIKLYIAILAIYEN